ncbi:MAG: arginase family protein, partial [Candidatus Thermoplasmatota archaeon]|nr:arginase family protein [Candidatus Thermoplasmatota archaeon]
VHLTFDIDGLDGTLVPATGTPVPGGLSFWHAVQAIEAVFSAPKATVISADVNEIARQDGTPLTQFTAAMVATKIVGAHVSARRAGRWEKAADGRGGDRAPMHRHTFTQGTPN